MQNHMVGGRDDVEELTPPKSVRSARSGTRMCVGVFV